MAVNCLTVSDRKELLSNGKLSLTMDECKMVES